MWRVVAEIQPDGRISPFQPTNDGGRDGVLIEIYLPHNHGGKVKTDAIKGLEDAVQRNVLDWISISHNFWDIDTDGLKLAVPELSALNWLEGKAKVPVEYESVSLKHAVVGTFRAVLSCVIVPDSLNNEVGSASIVGGPVNRQKPGMDKRYQVFVSSTYEDLKEERQHVTQALLKMGCIPSGMELFPASDDDQWTVIQRDIDECDYYLLILAGRYGSTDDKGKSYTEKEYDYAVSKKKPVIAFLHGNSGSLAYDISEKDPKLRRKLKLFCEKAKRKTVRFWSSRDELVAEISTSLPKLIRSHIAEGWVRGRFASDSEELIRLRSRIEELEGQLLNQARPVPSLPSEALTILKEAAGSRFGKIIVAKNLDGMAIQAGEFGYQEKGDPGKAALYEDILGKLHKSGLIDQINAGQYKVNHSGYEYIERLQGTGTANQSRVTLNIRDWRMRYMGTSGQGSQVEVKPETASYIEYYFNLDAFNDLDRGLGLQNIRVEFHEADSVLVSDEPGRYTGEVRAGAEYDPPMPVMTLPSREWVSVAIRGIIQGPDIPKVGTCDTAYVTADVTDGRHFKQLLASLPKSP